jgi:hypothetical protein
MMRGVTILWAILATVAGTALFLLKYEVQGQEERLRDLRKDIVDTEEAIHVLKAEWSYLNDPARLREQAERHLALHPLKPSQIGTIDSLPMAEPVPVAEGQPLPQPAPVAVPRPILPSPGEAAPLARPPGKSAPVIPTSRPAMAAAVAPSHPHTAGPAPAATGHVAAKAPPRTVVAAAKPLAKPPAKPASPSPAKSSSPATMAAGQPAPVTPYAPATPAITPVAASGQVMVITSPALLATDPARIKP